MEIGYFYTPQEKLILQKSVGQALHANFSHEFHAAGFPSLGWLLLLAAKQIWKTLCSCLDVKLNILVSSQYVYLQCFLQLLATVFSRLWCNFACKIYYLYDVVKFLWNHSVSQQSEQLKKIVFEAAMDIAKSQTETTLRGKKIDHSSQPGPLSRDGTCIYI